MCSSYDEPCSNNGYGKKVQKQPVYTQLSSSVFAKCQALWNKQGRSTHFADLVHSTFNLYLVTPNKTRWNSVFYSIERLQRLLTISPENMNDLLTEIGTLPFTLAERAFIKDYSETMKPAAQAFNILQGDEFCFLGYLLPTITELKKKLARCLELSEHCKPLVEALSQGLTK